MKIILTGNPLSTNNVYRTRGGGRGRYMTAQGKALKEDYQWQIKSQYKGKPLTGGLKLTVGLFFRDKRVRDIDNYNKLILDACNELVWEDDRQIQELTIKKDYDKDFPRAELVVSVV